MNLILPVYSLSAVASTAESAISMGRGRAQRVAAIINPEDGPGKKRDRAWGDAVEQLRDAGCLVLGYIGRLAWRGKESQVRERDDLQRDLRRYLEWYRVRDIFLDDASEETVGKLAQLLIAEASFVWANPGCVPKRKIVDAFDVTVIHEGQGFGKWDGTNANGRPIHDWAKDVPSTKLAIMATGWRGGVLEAIEKARSSGAGWVYVNPERDDWDTTGKSCYERQTPVLEVLVQAVKCESEG